LNIQYKTKTATKEDICAHLIECNTNFIPPLDEKVNIQEYSNKIYKRSITFEAWTDQNLIGLVAAYFNDMKNYSGYITNVSVVRKYIGKGIASELLNICIEYAIKNNFKEINLEVSEESNNAIHLYKNCGFLEFKSKDDFLLMKLVLANQE
jgi:ribosomal protein S18 acetylase RimI-like enzyme